MKAWKKILKKMVVFILECIVIALALEFLFGLFGVEFRSDILCVLVFITILSIDIEELKEELDRGGKR